jgi:hypothetical protein
MSQLNTQSEIGTAKFDAQAKAVGDLNAKFKEQTQDLVDAKDAIANYASTLSSEITRGFNLGAGFTMNNGEVDAQAWLAGVDSEVAKYEWYGNVLAAVQRDAGTNGEALRAYLASQGIDQGATMGQALIDAGLVATMGDGHGPMAQECGGGGEPFDLGSLLLVRQGAALLDQSPQAILGPCFPLQVGGIEDGDGAIAHPGRCPRRLGINLGEISGVRVSAGSPRTRLDLGALG